MFALKISRFSQVPRKIALTKTERTNNNTCCFLVLGQDVSIKTKQCYIDLIHIDDTSSNFVKLHFSKDVQTLIF